jgi:geranylgeranyl reductase family protein
MKYDVVIVGAGPAGASAALEFSKSNLRVLVIEKEFLPRDKPCGGAMPSSVEEILGINLSAVIQNRTSSVKIVRDYKDEVLHKTVGSNAPILVNRAEFDKFILDEALRGGADNIELLEGYKITSVKEKNDTVVLMAEDGREIETSYVIAADGALGKIASKVGLMLYKKFAQSVDVEIITHSDYYHQQKDVMIMNCFCLPQGYGWIFPKENNRFSCGIGTWGDPINIIHQLKLFIDNTFPKNAVTKMKVKGYPIPIYQGTQTIATKRVLLVGDAAGLVNPVTGEGIRYALLSGKIAAQTIINNAREKNCLVSSLYQKQIHEDIGKELKNVLFFIVPPFLYHPEMFYRNFVKRNLNQTFYHHKIVKYVEE